jgi:hypothetical protein
MSSTTFDYGDGAPFPSLNPPPLKRISETHINDVQPSAASLTISYHQNEDIEVIQKMFKDDLLDAQSRHERRIREAGDKLAINKTCEYCVKDEPHREDPKIWRENQAAHELGRQLDKKNDDDIQAAVQKAIHMFNTMRYYRELRNGDGKGLPGLKVAAMYNDMRLLKLYNKYSQVVDPLLSLSSFDKFIENLLINGFSAVLAYLIENARVKWDRNLACLAIKHNQNTFAQWLLYLESHQTTDVVTLKALYSQMMNENNAYVGDLISDAELNHVPLYLDKETMQLSYEPPVKLEPEPESAKPESEPKPSPIRSRPCAAEMSIYVELDSTKQMEKLHACMEDMGVVIAGNLPVSLDRFKQITFRLYDENDDDGDDCDCSCSDEGTDSDGGLVKVKGPPDEFGNPYGSYSVDESEKGPPDQFGNPCGFIGKPNKIEQQSMLEPLSNKQWFQL